MTAIPEGEAFQEAWNALTRGDRRRVRRLVRTGRPFEGGAEAAIAAGFARFQRSRMWVRLFWLWFIPGLLVALAIAARIHPVVVGVVLALAAQAVYARWNLARIERINSAVLGSSGSPGP